MTTPLDPVALAHRSSRRQLWSNERIAALVAANLAGAFLIGAGWFEGSGQLTSRGQLSWFNVGVLGVAIAGVTNVFFLLHGRRVVGLARGAVLPRVPARGEALGGTTRVTAAGLRHYHRADCALVAGRVVVPEPGRGFAASGLAPCEICEP